MSIQPLRSIRPFICAVLVLFSHFGMAASFDVSMTTTVSGITTGSGVGSGTATLDEATGTLTLNINSTTVTTVTNTTVSSVATVTGSFSQGSLSSVSGTNQLVSCTNNGGFVNGCNSITSDFGTAFLTDPINFDLSPQGVTTFIVRDSNSGATIEQTFTLVTAGPTPFSVSFATTVSGITSGSGSGNGTATLDEATGTLTLNINSTTVTTVTNTTVSSVATITGSFSQGSLSSVSGTNQLVSCTNNGGFVNGCNSITSDFGTAFLTDPINFDLSPQGVTTFIVRDSNSGATIEQTFTLIAGGAPVFGPPATIDLTSGGPTEYTFDPGDGVIRTLTISAFSGNITQDSSGLGNYTAFADDGAIDNYFSGSTRERVLFSFSEPVILDSVALDLFEPIATNERAQIELNGGGISVIDENSASRTGADLSNWRYLVGTEVSSFIIGTAQRSGIIGDSTFRINSLVVSSPLSVDTDEDGLLDYVETNTGIFVNANDTGTDPLDSDSDDDGILDGAELAQGTNPVDDDSDNDGLLDGAETEAGTDPLDSDSDDDGASDGDEVAGGTDPTVSQLPCDVDTVPALSLGDVLLLQRHLNTVELLSPNVQVFCDLDSDGSLTLTDLLILQRLLLDQ